MRGFALLLLAGCLLARPAGGQEDPPAEPAIPHPLDPLTAEEIATAADLALHHPQVRELLGDDGVQVSAVVHRVEKPEAPLPAEGLVDLGRGAAVYLYSPARHLGARAIVDLRRQAVTRVDSVLADSVPSGAGELALAWEIAREAPGVRALLGPALEGYRTAATYEESREIDLLVQGLPLRGAPLCEGGRCFLLLFRRGSAYLTDVDVIVDLRNRSVVVDDRRGEGVEP